MARRGQEPATLLPLAAIARRMRYPAHALSERLRRLGDSLSALRQGDSASSQGLPGPVLDSVGFVLANADEVEKKELYETFGVDIVISVLGKHSRTPQYPTGVQVLNFAIAWEGGRKKQCEN